MEFVEPEAAGLTEESGEEVVTDEETDLGTDWETVPSPRFCDIPSQVRHLVTLVVATRWQHCASPQLSLMFRTPSPLSFPLPAAYGSFPECTAGVTAVCQHRRDDLLSRRLRHFLVQSLHWPALRASGRKRSVTLAPQQEAT